MQGSLNHPRHIRENRDIAMMQIFDPAAGGSWKPSEFKTPLDVMGVMGMREINSAEAMQVKANASPQYMVPA